MLWSTCNNFFRSAHLLRTVWRCCPCLSMLHLAGYRVSMASLGYGVQGVNGIIGVWGTGCQWRHWGMGYRVSMASLGYGGQGVNGIIGVWGTGCQWHHWGGYGVQGVNGIIGVWGTGCQWHHWGMGYRVSMASLEYGGQGVNGIIGACFLTRTLLWSQYESMSCVGVEGSSVSLLIAPLWVKPYRWLCNIVI